MTIKFNLEGRDEGCAFFALYAGLRMYKEQRDKNTPKGEFSIASGEAFLMLEDLRENYPKQYSEAKKEFDEVYVEAIK